MAEFSGFTSLLIFTFPLFTVFLWGYWKLFEKSGRKGWEAIVPIYNLWVHLKIIGRPGWWLFLFFIPIINIFLGIGILVDLLRSFGKEKFYQHMADIVAQSQSTTIYQRKFPKFSIINLTCTWHNSR